MAVLTSALLFAIADPSESDTRQLLNWMVGKLPKSGEEGGGMQEVLGANISLNKSIADETSAWSKESWTLHQCSKHFPSGLRTKRYARHQLSTCPIQVPSIVGATSQGV